MATMVFIDGANLFASTKSLGFDTDFKRLHDYLWCNYDDLVRINYYTALLDTEKDEHNPLRKMVDWLSYNGFNLVTKLAKTFTNNGVTKTKGNMDIEIATDILDAANYCSHILLLTGDGDFKYALDAVKRKGVRVTVISTIKTNPPFCADELRRAADHYIDLADIKHTIARARGVVENETGD